MISLQRHKTVTGAWNIFQEDQAEGTTDLIGIVAKDDRDVIVIQIEAGTAMDPDELRQFSQGIDAAFKLSANPLKK